MVRALDGPLAPLPCASVSAFQACEDCRDVEACTVRRLMRDVRDAIAGVLDHKTLADVAAHHREAADDVEVVHSL